jgi:hypothetical protein
MPNTEQPPVATREALLRALELVVQPLAWCIRDE